MTETPPITPSDLSATDAAHVVEHYTQVMAHLSTGSTLADTLDYVARALEHLMPASRSSILLLDAPSGTLHHGAAPSLPAPYSAAIDGLAIGPSAGSCGTAAYLGTAVVAYDVRTDPRWENFRELAAVHGLVACWSSPIERPTGVVGTFAVYHDEPYHPTPRAREVVSRFSNLAAIVIAHHRLFGALATSEARFRRAFDNNSVGMAIAGLDGRLERVNDALRDLVGRSDTELVGATLDDALQSRGAARRRMSVLWRAQDATAPDKPSRDRTSASDGNAVTFEIDAFRSDGAAIRVAVAASVVDDGDGHPHQLSINLLDVTHRRSVERERRARREADVARVAAETANRAKSAFVASLSHEMRTPLQSIAGFTELLATRDLGEDRRSQALAHIQHATHHITALVDDLLDIARIEAGALVLEPQPCDVNAVIAGVVEMLRPAAASHAAAFRWEPRRVEAYADPLRLRQVLLNIVGNAIRYGGHAGVVDIAVDHDDTEVRIAVGDRGAGIPPALMDRVFVPFDRLGAETGSEIGVGLGLVLARGLSEAMHGRLELASEVGVGTTVTVVLPRRAGSPTGSTVSAVATGSVISAE